MNNERMTPTRAVSFVLAVLLAGAAAHAADGPALPAGLSDAGQDKSSAASDGPALPGGLPGADDATSDGPALPGGLPGEAATAKAPKADATTAKQPTTWLDSLKEAGLRGFWEVRGGVRTQRDPYEKQASLGETRLQLEFQRNVEEVTFKIVGDFVYDQAYNHLSNVNLVTGSGWFDLREAWAQFTPLEFMDVKVGRQVLTWGTGDLLFLNDLFPKDWQSFFLGRDLQYLKAPSDAVRVSLFSDLANADLVYMPRFNPSRGITGRRLSYWSPQLGRRAGRDAIIEPDRPDRWFDDGEYAARVYRKIGSYELAAYGHWGYWKTPEGFDPAAGKAFYPRLNVYGGSVRGPLGAGIANVEAAWYDSRDDRHGENPNIRNSELRLLAGYQADLPQIASDLSVGFQYYVELMDDYDSYRDTLPAGMNPADRDRHVLTFKVKKLLLNQNLTVELFAYYSPSDGDAYLRPSVSYKLDDHWTIGGGGNIFFGVEEYTFFGQFQRDSNLYAFLRYGF